MKSKVCDFLPFKTINSIWYLTSMECSSSFSQLLSLFWLGSFINPSQICGETPRMVYLTPLCGHTHEKWSIERFIGIPSIHILDTWQRQIGTWPQFVKFQVDQALQKQLYFLFLSIPLLDISSYGIQIYNSR